MAPVDETALKQALETVHEKPIFHVMPTAGWVNDPNGPFFWNGRYHLFYQHLPSGCTWDWGLVWGHAVSEDLVRWQHMPPAIAPTPAGLDADGCFSGCAVVDEDGTPTLLYTGVRLRSNPLCGPLPPAECDLNLPFIETQCAAVADPGDDDLVTWTKVDVPVIPLPPPNMPLAGWRDPVVVACRAGSPSAATSLVDSTTDEWVCLIGSGLMGQGGTALVYSASNLTAGPWRFEGELCHGDGTTGLVWECPLLVKLPVQPGGCPALDQATAAAGAAPPADGTGTSSGTDGGGNVTSCASAAGQHCAAGTASSPAKAAATAATSNPPAAVTPHGGATTSSPADDAPQRADAAGTRTADPAGAGAVAGSESGAASSSAATDKSAAALSSPTLMVRSPSLASSPSSSNSSSTSREDAAVAALHAAPAAGPAGLSREGVSPTSHPTITAALGSAAPHVDAAHLFFFCVSPDVPTNPALYWLGNYDGGTKQFDLASSLGPYRLDLGDVLYAPNVLRDGGGRLLLWGWLQERRKVGVYSYAGCLTLPRVLSIRGCRLMQHPVPELVALRSCADGASWVAADLPLPSGVPVPVQNVQGSFLDIEVTLERGASTSAGLVLRSWLAGSEGSAAVMVHWDTCRLEVVFEAIDPETLQFSLDAPAARRIGGTLAALEEEEKDGATAAAAAAAANGPPLAAPAARTDGEPPGSVSGADAATTCINGPRQDGGGGGENNNDTSTSGRGVADGEGVTASPPAGSSSAASAAAALSLQRVDLRLLLDMSCLEVYAPSSGEVLSTRVYRGVPPQGEGCGIDLVSQGGDARVVSISAHEMSTIWDRSTLLHPKGAAETAAGMTPLEVPGAADYYDHSPLWQQQQQQLPRRPDATLLAMSGGSASNSGAASTRRAASAEIGFLDGVQLPSLAPLDVPSSCHSYSATSSAMPLQSQSQQSHQPVVLRLAVSPRRAATGAAGVPVPDAPGAGAVLVSY